MLFLIGNKATSKTYESKGKYIAAMILTYLNDLIKIHT